MTTFSYTVSVIFLLIATWSLATLCCGRLEYAQCHFLANLGRLITKQPLKFWDYQGYKRAIEEDRDRKEFLRLSEKYDWA